MAKSDGDLLRMTVENKAEFPLVSIGMPVRNGEDHLSLALDSLLAQDYGNFELIISDNGSADRTQEICREYAAKDPRIKYIRHPANIGPAENFNFLLEQARGDYFMWAASDDIWDKSFVKTLLDALVADPKRVAAFCPYSFINGIGKPIEEMGIRRIDYSSRTRLGRFIKLCWYFDDGCFYGLYKRQAIKDVRMRRWTWRGSNPANLMNIGYPMLFYIFSAGDFALAGSSPLWLNRIHRGIHFQPFYLSPLRGYFAFLLRKVNVVSASMQSIYAQSSSIFLTIASFPPLLMRFVMDAFSYWRTLRLRHVFRKMMTFASRRNAS